VRLVQVLVLAREHGGLGPEVLLLGVLIEPRQHQIALAHVDPGQLTRLARPPQHVDPGALQLRPLPDLRELSARKDQPLPGPVRLLDDAQRLGLAGGDEDTDREARRPRHAVALSMKRSASFTRSSPEMSLGKSVSRTAARERVSVAALLTRPNIGATARPNAVA